ncbi:MAG: hypothetical protein ACE5J0_02150 [Candidatus Paceibacterales bacterium]
MRETIILTKKEYSELKEIKKRLEKLLRAKEKKISPKKDGFLEAFGILKGKFKGTSLDYTSKLRREWRK